MSAFVHPISQSEQLEAARLEALRRYAVLDTPGEIIFERLAALTAMLFRAPIAVVGFIDETRHWFKSAVGTWLREAPRDESFCTHTIGRPGVFQVPDALEDPRFRNAGAVRRMGVRAYAGAPLTTPDGQRIGSLCFFDDQPRGALNASEQGTLERLAELVMAALNERLEGKPHRFADEGFAAALETILGTLSLEKQPLYGQPAEAPPLPGRISASGESSEDRLLARIRAAPPAPIPAFVTRLPENRALLAHRFGFAAPDRTWQAWALEPSGPPRSLETFVAPVTLLHLPPQARLLLLSEETRGATLAAPTRVLASGKL